MPKTIPVRLLLLALIVCFFLQIGFMFFEFPVEVRIVGVNLFLAFMQFLAVYYVLRSNLGQLANRFLAVGFSVVGLASFIRALGILVTGDDIYGADQEWGRLFFIGLAVVNITEGFTCLGDLLIDRIDLVSKQALTDPLTNCFNRRGFDELAAQTIEKAKRGNNETVLIVADLDRFKRVNDTYGHGAGDNAIKAFANLLSDEIRTVDLLGRLGGEEFIILLWQTDLIERIRMKLTKTSIHGLPYNFRVTSSFGATTIDSDDNDMNAIIHRADLALYRAKHNGRDQLQCLTKDEEQQAQSDFDKLEAKAK